MIFFITLRQKLLNIATQITFINNLHKKLNLVCNFNINSLKIYGQLIIIILQKIMILIKDHFILLPPHETLN